MEETNNPIVEKLLDFAKNKSYLTWDEVTEFLGQDFVNSPEMESIIKILNEKNIQLIEPSIIQPDDVPEDALAIARQRQLNKEGWNKK